MLEPTCKNLPDQTVLCATQRGMVDGHMSVAAQKAFVIAGAAPDTATLPGPSWETIDDADCEALWQHINTR